MRVPAYAVLASLAVVALLASGCASNGPGTSGPQDGGATSDPSAATTTTPAATTSGTRSSATTAQPSSSEGATSCDPVTRSGLALADATAPVAAIATVRGCIVVELNKGKAPITVANFETYANERFYDGTLFHRIGKGFMVQGGGMAADGQFKAPTHDPITNEARSSGLKNVKYSIAMARQAGPDTATNQFFVNHANNTFLDPGPDPDNPSHAGYAAFGMVVQGQDVVDLVAATPVTFANAPDANPHCQPDRSATCPKTDVVIHSIRILP